MAAHQADSARASAQRCRQGIAAKDDVSDDWLKIRPVVQPCHNHHNEHMVAIYTVWYNWVRIHKSLRVTPAMAANLTTRLWDWEEIVVSMDAAEQPKKRGPYKKAVIA